jgi:transcription-repair coupling factor (superfamily II helicase)
MRSSRIASIINSAQILDEPVRVHGGTAPAFSLLVSRYFLERSRSILVLCKNDDAAAAFADDFESLCPYFTGGLRLSALRVPSWEQSPYSPIAPSIRTRQLRLAALSAAAHATSPFIVVSTPAALGQATIPKAEFENYSLHLKVGASIDSRETLLLRLTQMGYQRVDTVEDGGSFAARGEIVDIFAPDSPAPVRIELFGDEVEKIRPFDPATQRTSSQNEGSILSLTIPPAREVLINTVTQTMLREKVKARSDDLGVSRGVRDPVLSAIQNGMYPDHCDAWAPFAYQNPESFFNYLPDTCDIFWNDELAAIQNWDDFLADQEKLAEESPKSSLILPPVGSLFKWGKELEAQCRAQTKIYFDYLNLTDVSSLPKPGEEDLAEMAEGSSGPGRKDEDPIRAKHQIAVKSNRDLEQGTKQALGKLEPKFKLWLKQGFKVLCLASTQSQLERIRFLLTERDLLCHADAEPKLLPSTINLGLGSLSEGFRWPAEGWVILTEDEILGSKHVHKARQAKKKESSAAKDWSGLQALTDLAIGDAIVHVDHGIGRYQGLVRLSLSGAPSDFLLIEYANKDKLYLPVYRLNAIQKYVGAGESAQLDRLGSQHFARAKDKVREAVKTLAVDLVQIYAERKVRPGLKLSPRDSMFREFEAKFPFDETPDQLKAIDEILNDLESGRVSDRLVCGDVGYGKTEVAMRAAFRAVSDGKQVAVLVPTTVLAFQHEQSFKLRMKDYPISIESVSRFKSAKEQKKILADVNAGKVDIVIGTHRLLSKDVHFKNLALVIVDEEHRFGVEHKEKLKTLKINTHVLTLTATPIPRTLHMALAGLREISLINTPPVDRLPIRTYVSKQDDELIKRAVEFELTRGGQVFYLHNRVQTIDDAAKRIRDIVPNASVGIAHGQMSETALEKAMLDFYEKKVNVLVCTTIIESGLDLPSANTMIISRADTLGLAQLYQIRGRVGRGQNRAYAYLLIPEEGAVTEDAKRRLEVIQRFVELGSGFSIASHDLEIRGGGDLLGPQQSGHIAAVGFDLYTELLEEAIHEVEGRPYQPENQQKEPEIKVPYAAFLSEEYVPDVHQRLSLYRRLSAANDSELTLLEEELADRFGPLPPEGQNLIWMIRIKQLLKEAGVEALTAGPEKVSLTVGALAEQKTQTTAAPPSRYRIDPVRAIALMSSDPDRYQLLPESKFIVKIPTKTLRDLYFSLETLFARLTSA